MSVAPAFYKGLSKKRCFFAIFLGFFTVFSMDFIGLSVVSQLIVDYINYNIMERADTIKSVQFDIDKQDYDVNSVSYDTYVSVYVIV